MKHLILLILAIVLLQGCSLQKVAVRTTTPIFGYGIDAIYSEPDLKMAEQAIASNLKLLEGFHRADPGNEQLLLMLTQGFASYALGFVEDADPERAKLFYLRSRDYGLTLLKKRGIIKEKMPATDNNFAAALQKCRKDDVPAVFWTAFAWGSWINISKDNPRALFDLGKVKAMMQRVMELDESFFFGSAHLFFGAINGALPKMLGGNPDKAKEHFERCLQLTDHKFMLGYVYLARYYAQPILEEDLFDEYLKTVLEAPVDILPGYELITAIAQQKARILQKQKEDLF
ncbi:MAG: hypothetical protein Kow0037_32600 [Calditrichia bacterium]